MNTVSSLLLSLLLSISTSLAITAEPANSTSKQSAAGAEDSPSPAPDSPNTQSNQDPHTEERATPPRREHRYRRPGRRHRDPNSSHTGSHRDRPHSEFGQLLQQLPPPLRAQFQQAIQQALQEDQQLQQTRQQLQQTLQQQRQLMQQHMQQRGMLEDWQRLEDWRKATMRQRRQHQLGQPQPETRNQPRPRSRPPLTRERMHELRNNMREIATTAAMQDLRQQTEAQLNQFKTRLRTWLHQHQPELVTQIAAARERLRNNEAPPQQAD